MCCKMPYSTLSAMQVSNMVSRELEKECVVVFDEAHNIDNVCIEVCSLSNWLPLVREL